MTTAVNTPPWPPATEQAMLGFMCGDVDAVAFVRLITSTSHAYDDLIDKDKVVTDERIHDFVRALLFDLPLNPFFAKYEPILRPLIMVGVLNWRAANEMEKSGIREELRLAHVMRYSVADAATMAMVICGGFEHAVANTRKLRLMLQQDTWQHYVSEHSGD